MKRAILLIICLPVLAFIWTCSGGGGGKTQDVTEGEQFLKNYQGNIGGQIRAVTSAFVSLPDTEPVPMILWGLGSSIQYGTAGAILGPLLLKNKGAVTDMVSYGTPSKPKIFYGSERGIGIVNLNDDGKIAETAFVSVPEGVNSVTTVKEGSGGVFYYTTGDGSLMTTDEAGVTSKGAATKIISSADLKEEETAYLPVKAAVMGTKAFVLAKNSVSGGLTPTFAQAFDPILINLITGRPSAIVRMVDTGTKAVSNVSFIPEAGRFTGFDTFIPTDVTTDGTNFYVAGLAYEKAAADSFVITKCDKPSLDEKLVCMRAAAKSGDLIKFKTSGGYDAFTAGFFIYRDVAKVSDKATFFARATFAYQNIEDAPSLIFHMAVSYEVATLRASNFLAIMTRSADHITGDEDWVTSPAFDARNGLLGGVPANLVTVISSGSTFSAATFVGVKNEDGSGTSMLEIGNTDGTFLIGDTGAIKTRMDDAKAPYIVAIDLATQRGGALYLENDTGRKKIEPGMSKVGLYVAHAAYKGENLAFAWSAPGDAWRIEWQKGEDDATRGQLSFSRTGDAKHFKDFPSVSSSDVKALEDARDIADLEISEGKLFALLYGYAGGKHYYQAIVYGGGYTESKFHPAVQGMTNTPSYKGDEIDRRARFQKITKSDAGVYTVTFSCAAGLFSFEINPSSGAAPSTINSLTTPLKNVMDLDFDETGETFAFIQSKTIRIRSLSDPATDISATALPSAETASDRLSNASIVLTSKKLYIAAPVGASEPFWVIDISDPKTPKVDSSCSSCNFNGLAMFDDFPDRLLASSDTCGVEIYNVSGTSTP